MIGRNVDGNIDDDEFVPDEITFAEIVSNVSDGITFSEFAEVVFVSIVISGRNVFGNFFNRIVFVGVRVSRSINNR